MDAAYNDALAFVLRWRAASWTIRMIMAAAP